MANQLPFDKAMQWLREAEGGWAEHPADEGGQTRWGISSVYHPNVDLASLTWEGAVSIYMEHYWKRFGCDSLPEGDAICLFDSVVLHGSLGVKLYQRALKVQADGVIGPLTIHAAVERRKEAGDAHLLDHLARRGLLCLQQSPEEVKAFGRGWLLRLFRLSTYLELRQ